jgi:hypothetical protein
LIKFVFDLGQVSGFLQFLPEPASLGKPISISIHVDGKIRGVRVMVFNIIFNDISAISWQSVLLVEETGENH